MSHAESSPTPGAMDVSGDQPMQQLGRLVRALRTDAGLTLADLADAADVSVGLISQIERGQGNPSYNTLIKLAHALNVKVGEFFGGQEPEQKAAGVVRAGARRRLLMTERDMVYELLTPSMNGRLGMIRAQIAAGWSNEAVPYLHEGEESIFIAQGALVVVVGSERYELDEGDSLTYDASVPHWYANVTAEPAVLIGAMTPPSF